MQSALMIPVIVVRVQNNALPVVLLSFITQKALLSVIIEKALLCIMHVISLGQYSAAYNGVTYSIISCFPINSMFKACYFVESVAEWLRRWTRDQGVWRSIPAARVMGKNHRVSFEST